MGNYVRTVWDGDEQAQRAYPERGFAPERWQIITVNHTDVGVISIDYHPTYNYPGRIEILPDHQGHGIGSQLIDDLLDQAATSARTVILDVLSINGRAQRLYERLRFTPDTPHETHQAKIRMTARPNPHPQS